MKERTKLIFKITAIVLLLLMAIESFLVANPYSITVGIMLLLTSILFIPNLEKKVNIPLKGKIFIFITNFFTTAYTVKIEDTNYFKCVIATVIMLVFWLITIIYFKRKENGKDSKKANKEK